MWDIPTIVTVELFQQVKIKEGALTMTTRADVHREDFGGV